MLALRFELELAPVNNPEPEFFGGALHGFFEGAIKRHAPHLLSVLRPEGANAHARFALGVPTYEAPPATTLHFDAMLYGNARDAWRQIARAILAQRHSGLNGRRVRLVECHMDYPGDPVQQVLLDERLLEEDANFGDHPLDRRDFYTPIPTPYPRLYALGFDVPLLLASRKVQRREGELPWPTLGRVLESIADRLRVLEPELARALGVEPVWLPPDIAFALEPLTLAATPARQILWRYRSTPRGAVTKESEDKRRDIPIPGIVGDLVYPACGDPLEFALLYWGQWLRVGQKTTMGFGAYRLSAL